VKGGRTFSKSSNIQLSVFN